MAPRPDDAVGQAARPLRRLLTPVGLAAILGADATFLRYDPPLLLTGVLDEAAHLSTAAILLLGLPRVAGPRPFWAGLLAGAVLIDLDHLPAELGWFFLTRGTPRPYTHSLATVAVTLLVAALLPGRWRTAALGVAVGVAAHLFRDLATGEVALWWPASAAPVRIPYLAYLAVMLIAAGRVLAAAGRRGGD